MVPEIIVVDDHQTCTQTGALHVVVDDRRGVIVERVARTGRQEALRSLSEDDRQQRRLLPQRVLAVAADVVEEHEQRAQRTFCSGDSSEETARIGAGLGDGPLASP